MNYCKNCGAKLPENSNQCNICGAKQPGINMNGQQNINQAPQQMNGDMGQNPYMPNNFDNPYQQNQQDIFSNQANETKINQNPVFQEQPEQKNEQSQFESNYSQVSTNPFEAEQSAAQNNQFYNQQAASNAQNTDYQQTYPRRSQTVSNHNSLDYSSTGGVGLTFMILGWVSVAFAIFSGMLWLPLSVLFAGSGVVMGYLYRSYNVKHGMIILIMSIDAGILGIMIGFGFAVRSGLSMLSGLL